MKVKVNNLIKVVIAFLLLYLPAIPGWSQKKKAAMEHVEDTARKIDIIDIVKSRFRFSPKTVKRNPGKKVYFSLLPVSSQVPGGGRALITTTTAGFYLGNRSNTFLSHVTFSPYLNFKGRYSVAFRSNLYTKENRWNILGDIRFLLYPEYIYG